MKWVFIGDLLLWRFCFFSICFFFRFIRCFHLTSGISYKSLWLFMRPHNCHTQLIDWRQRPTKEKVLRHLPVDRLPIEREIILENNENLHIIFNSFEKEEDEKKRSNSTINLLFGASARVLCLDLFFTCAPLCCATHTTVRPINLFIWNI